MKGTTMTEQNLDPAVRSRAHSTAQVNQILAEAAERMKTPKDNPAPVEESELLTRAQFLSRVLGLTDEQPRDEAGRFAGSSEASRAGLTALVRGIFEKAAEQLEEEKDPPTEEQITQARKEFVSNMLGQRSTETNDEE
jgi:hypothetical protein